MLSNSAHHSFFAATNGTVTQPKNQCELIPAKYTEVGEWYLKASYNNNGKASEAIPRIDLGLSRSDQDFSNATKIFESRQTNFD